MSTLAVQLLLAALIFGLSVLAGVAPRALIGRIADQRLATFTSVGAGLLLASALLVVVPEGFDVASAVEEHGHDHGHGDEPFVHSPLVLGAAILAGFVLMLLLEGFGIGHAVHEEHHDHEEGHGHGHVHHPTSMTALGIGLSAHAVADGLAIGSAAAAGDEAFSFLVAGAVLLHRIPAAFSLGLFALHETDSRRRADLSIVGFALATPLAMVIAFLALDSAGNDLLSLVMLFSAGTFVYVATVDTLPAIHHPTSGRRSARDVVIGAALFAAALWLVDLAGWLDHAH